MNGTDDTKSRLRELRDRLSFELPRARVRPNTPPQLVERLKDALDAVTGAYAMPTALTSSAAEAVEEARHEAIADAHVVLHEWERWAGVKQQPKLKAQPPKPRRTTPERSAGDVQVRLLRYRVQGGDGREVAFADSNAARAARNVSADGIFVAMPKDELPQLGTGGVLQLTTVDSAVALQARATVVRRDADGVALRWIVDNERTRHAIESLLEAARRSRRDR